MKFNVKKCGSNDKGVWVYGTLDMGGFEINAIFKTNLKQVVEVGDTLNVKKIKMTSSRTRLFYELVF